MIRISSKYKKGFMGIYKQLDNASYEAVTNDLSW
jgi:hypothetical protein